MFGIQISVLVVAVFTAFVAYQFRIREKKRDLAHAELLKSYGEVYSPILFLLKEINGTPKGQEKEALIDKMFNDYGLVNSKTHLIGAVKTLNIYFELTGFYRAYKNNKESYEEKFLECLEKFNDEINKEFWDAHNIIYKEHIRYKNHHFHPVKSLFLDLLATLKFISELGLSCSIVMWALIATNIIFKLDAFSVEIAGSALAISLLIFILYIFAVLYNNQFYNKTNNLYKKRR